MSDALREALERLAAIAISRHRAYAAGVCGRFHLGDGWVDEAEKVFSEVLRGDVEAILAALSAQVPEDDAGLVERLRSSAKAFRENPIYTLDGDGVYLSVQADELEQAADRIEAMGREDG